MVSSSYAFPSDAFDTFEVEAVGSRFVSHWCSTHTLEKKLEEDQFSDSGSSDEDEDPTKSEGNDVDDDECSFGRTPQEIETDLVYLKSLDPKEHKEQDHYRVLGLNRLRYRATEEQIKKSYRYMVLKHHPDKRGDKFASGSYDSDSDYFPCITAAFEVLGTKAKRRAFDSVDPDFDETIPGKTVDSDSFFDTFTPVFTSNARFSTRRHVPKLGDSTTSRSKVDAFYAFWYSFESWREFSYLDEEDKERGSDRDERRWIEKNNRIQRAERKKEDNRRIRKLVDNAYNNDPRIKKFLEDDRNEKAAKKKAKQDAIRERRLAEERVAREQREAEDQAREEEQQRERERLEQERQEKEAQKKEMKKERRALRNVCKSNAFFASNEQEKVNHMAEVDKLCEILELTALQQLNAQLEEAKEEKDRKNVFMMAMSDVNARLEREKLGHVETNQKSTGGGSANRSKVADTTAWTTEEVALLIKAVKLFPAGTNQRWDVVAEFLSQHSGTPRSGKETLAKAKWLQSDDFRTSSVKKELATKSLEEAQRKADSNIAVAEATTRTETAAEAQGLNVTPWSEEEQKLLEQALKTYPSSLGAQERWERIAACIPNRSKKDCMKRYKELAEVVRAKKAALAKVAKT